MEEQNESGKAEEEGEGEFETGEVTDVNKFESATGLLEGMSLDL